MMCHIISRVNENSIFFEYGYDLIGVKNFSVNYNEYPWIRPNVMGAKQYKMTVHKARIVFTDTPKEQSLLQTVPTLEYGTERIRSFHVRTTVIAGMHIDPLETSEDELGWDQVISGGYLAKFAPADIIFYDGYDISVRVFELQVLDPDKFPKWYCKERITSHNRRVEEMLEFMNSRSAQETIEFMTNGG